MHKMTGNRKAVLEVLRQTVFHLGRNDSSVHTKRIGMAQIGVKSDSQWTAKRDETIDMLQRAYEREQDKEIPTRQKFCHDPFRIGNQRMVYAA